MCLMLSCISFILGPNIQYIGFAIYIYVVGNPTIVDVGDYLQEPVLQGITLGFWDPEEFILLWSF